MIYIPYLCLMKNKEVIEVVKAAKRGQREAELENSCGFKSMHKIFKSKKYYNRRKYKEIISEQFFYLRKTPYLCTIKMR